MSPPGPEDQERSREAASSEASSTSSPYTSGPGPGYDPNAAPPPPPEVDAPPSPAEAFEEAWKEEQVRDWLLNTGALAHAGFGVGENDWKMTQADLDRIAPPATRILNRYQPTRLAAAYSDPAAVAMGFGLYGWRSALERIAVKRAEAEEEESSAAPAPGPAPASGPAIFSAPAAPPDDGLLAADRLRAQRQNGEPSG